MLNPTPANPKLKGVGTCRAWANLFRQTLLVQGITGAQVVQVLPIYSSSTALATNQKDGVMLVKNWDFIDPGTASAACNIFKYVRSKGEFVDKSGAAGQGVENPPGGFYNHYIVRYDSKYYDPSYGTGPFPNKSEWENASLAGYEVACADGAIVGKKNETSVDEVTFSP